MVIFNNVKSQKLCCQTKDFLFQMITVIFQMSQRDDHRGSPPAGCNGSHFETDRSCVFFLFRRIGQKHATFIMITIVIILIMIKMKMAMIGINMINTYQHDDSDNGTDSDNDNKNDNHNDNLYGSKVGDGRCKADGRSQNISKKLVMIFYPLKWGYNPQI